METKRCAVTGKEYVGCVWCGSPRRPPGTVAAEKQMDIGGSEITETTERQDVCVSGPLAVKAWRERPLRGALLFLNGETTASAQTRRMNAKRSERVM